MSTPSSGRSWLQALPAYTDRSKRIPIDGTLRTFYPLSTGMLFSLRGLTPIASRAFASFMEGGAGKDQRRIENAMRDDKEGVFTSRIETEPVTAEMTASRIAMREKSLRELLDAMFSDDTKALVGTLILDSMRPRDDETPITSDEGLAFLNGMPIDVLGEYVKAIIEANQGVLGPLAERVSGIKAQVMSRINEALASAPAGSPKSPSENPPAAPPESEIPSDQTRDLPTLQDLPTPGVPVSI